MSFDQAFAAEAARQGPGKKFMWQGAEYTTDKEDKGLTRIYKSFTNSAYLTYVGCYWFFAFIYLIITGRLDN